MLARVRAAIPPALLVAFALIGLGSPILDLYQAHVARVRDYSHVGADAAAVSLAGLGLWFLKPTLIGLALLELGRRRRGHERTLLYVAAGVALAAISGPIVSAWFGYADRPSLATMVAYARWSTWAWAALWTLAGACVATLVVRRGRAGLVVAVAVMLTTVVAHPLRVVDELIRPTPTPGHAWINAAIDIAITWSSLAALGAAAYLLGKDAPATTWSPGQLLTGIERVGTALVLRVLAALGTGLITTMAIGARSPGLMKAIVVVVPPVLVGALIAQISGLFAAAGDATGPRLRLTAAGALTTFAMVVMSAQAVAAFRVARDRWGSGSLDSWDSTRLADTAQALPYLTPAALLLGVVLLLSSLGAMRRARPDLDPGAVTTAGVLTVGGSLAALWLARHALRHVGSPGEFVLLTALVAACNIAALIAVARLCHKTVWALRLGSDGLPPARIVDGNSM